MTLLEAADRNAGARIRAALAVRFRSLDLAEEAYAEACARAARAWDHGACPADPAAWLYRTAARAALDLVRRAEVRTRLLPPAPEPGPTPEDAMLDDARLIPDERLRLIFICCHPALAPDVRAALTLRIVCGLPVPAIARAFLVPDATLAQRLVRAKRKIAEAGVPFELPAPERWRDRLGAVLSTVEIAYARAHEDGAGTGAGAGFADEALRLTLLLTELMPEESDVWALAAIVHFAEARRPARCAADGLMVPLSDQDPSLWDQALIARGHGLLERARAEGNSPRVIQAMLQGVWCARPSLDASAPWPEVLALYDRLLGHRDDPFVRINRAVALAEVEGPAAALAELDRLDPAPLAGFPPFLATRADLLRRLGRGEEARAAYGQLLALDLPDAERRWLERRAAAVEH